MTDFFISYTNVDRSWAEWIAYVLEEENYGVIIQAWDFRPGSNFVLEMQKASATASRTIMVLSPDYLKSVYASPEWAAAFAQDPQGWERKLVPVQVQPCSPSGMLAPIVQIRLVGLDQDHARKALLDGVIAKRAKPPARPPFPGITHSVPPKVFPGPPTNAAPTPSRASVIPALKRTPTDIDRRRFVQSGFASIKELFERNLQVAQQEESRIETDFQPNTATDFRAEIFVDGKNKCSCRVWQGGMHSENNICFSEGRAMFLDNSCSEIISLAQGDELRFHALLASNAFGFERRFNVEQMTAEEAAEYLWSRFILPLSW